MRFGFGRQTPDLVCYFETEGGGAGAPAAGNSGATPAAPTGTPSAPAPGSNAGPATAGAGAGAKPAFTYQEDRSNWVPSHVIRERTQKAEAARQQLERELDYERRRVAALTGVKPPAAPRNPAHEQIRQQFLEVFPEYEGLAKLDPAKLEKIMSMDVDALTRAQAQTQDRLWTNHGAQAVQLFAQEAKAIYGSDVQPKQMKRMLNAFIAECQDDPQMLQRYESGDPSVIKEFIADWGKDFVEPVRKLVSQPTQGQVAARRLPRSGSGTAVTSRQPSLKPSDPKIHDAAYEAFQRSQSVR